ncbi:FkbM family methyltransferase [Ramlibacter sp. AN1015]|uniref:FkbM family methyltransferase n=1 Tax=Ramlibacter sp. AN1015 TaxID=3133428 RepID=UPI0030C22EC3
MGLEDIAIADALLNLRYFELQMLTALSFRQRVKLMGAWVKDVGTLSARLPFSTLSRFLVLTPGVLQTQVIYDRIARRWFTVNVRDLVDVQVVRQIFANNDYGFERLRRGEELRALYERIVSSGQKPLIIDCGANSGMSVRYFSETYPHAHIVAIEPDEANLAQAKLNNRAADVTYLHAGVASSSMRATLCNRGQGNWAYQVEADPKGAIQLVSISSILTEHARRGAIPFAIKIDIEGFEENLFEKGIEWIDEFPVLIIELHDWMLPRQGNSKNFLKAIALRNRDFVLHGENVFSISNTLT